MKKKRIRNPTSCATHNHDGRPDTAFTPPKTLYSHDRTGVASLLAALADQERSGRLILKHLLGLRPAQLTHEPVGLFLVWQILLVPLQHVRAEEEKDRKKLYCNTFCSDRDVFSYVKCC